MHFELKTELLVHRCYSDGGANNTLDCVADADVEKSHSREKYCMSRYFKTSCKVKHEHTLYHTRVQNSKTKHTTRDYFELMLSRQ